MEEAAYGDRNVVLLSSTQSRWSGFPLNRQGVLAKGYLKGGAPSPSHSIVLTVAGSIGVEVGGARAQRRFVAGPGSITIWPKGFHLRWISWTSLARPCEAINVELDAASLAHLAPSEDALADVALTHESGIADPTLAALVQLMEADVAAGCPTGRLYGESLSLALGAQLVGRYSRAPAKAPLKGGLSRHQLRCVLEYVGAHFSRELSIPELSKLVDLSPYYFCRAFRASVGVSPHQYVIAQRIGAARRLLAARRQSIADVALAVGFADQSHFAQTFRKATGTTPERYRRER